MNKRFAFDALKISLCTILLCTQGHAAMKDNVCGKRSYAEFSATEKNPPVFSTPTEASTLGFGYNSITDDEFIEEVKYLKTKQLINCINLAYQSFITDKTLEFITSNFPDLESIILIECNKITDAGVQTLVKGCPWLRIINLDDCHQITAAGINDLPEYCPYLKKLNLYRCAHINDNVIKNIIGKCQYLESLDLGMTCLITDEGLLTLANKCIHLKELHLECCDKPSYKSIKAFFAKLPHCKVFDHWATNDGNLPISGMQQAAMEEFDRLKSQGF